MARLKLFIRAGFLSTAFILVFLLSLFFLQRNGFFNIHSIQVSQIKKNQQQRFAQPLLDDLQKDLQSQQGIPLWQVDLLNLQKSLLQRPWIEDISISRRWPATLEVQVVVKEVDLLLLTSSGNLQPVLRTGEVLPASPLQSLPDVAILHGEQFEKHVDLRQQAIQLLRGMPKEGLLSASTISEIHYDQRDGFWMTLVRDGLLVKLGQDHLALKSARVSQVLGYIESRSLDARVIDANLSKKVLVRLRKSP